MIRRTARNRVGNQLARTPGGESAATALAAPSDPIYLFAPHAANRSPTQGPPGEPPHGLRSDDGVAGAERLVAPRHATAGKNGSGAVRSAVAVIRQSRTAHLVSDTIVHSCADQI